MFSQAVKTVVEQLPLPLAGIFWRLSAFRWRNAPGQESRAACRRLFKVLKQPNTVLAGPFRGMHYLPQAHGSALLPKILGTYEMEISASVEGMCQRAFELVVDIGAAEGYYAIGLACRIPHTRIVCYELNPLARHLLRRLAKRNGMYERVEIHKECTVQHLNESLCSGHRCLVICDCEGCEDLLLNPELVPALRRASVIVELHDFDCPGVSDRIRWRFSSTHSIQVFWSRPRTLNDLPPVPLTGPEALQAMDEWRPRQSWFVMEPTGPL